MERQPALDGLRAVAVILVLLFHAGFTWMPAGYLGVSVFFTLSGFLITSLLLHEHAATGRISAREFYARRVRRLMPASLLCVTGIVVANFFGAFRGVSGLRTDLLASVFQVFNWVQLAGTTSYGDLFGGASSPFEHMWSLSIEEQAYWVWPLAVVALVAVAGRRRIHAMAALFVVLSAGAVVIARLWGPDAAYWATPARLPEIAAGAVLACAMVGGARVPTWAKWWAPAALAGIIVLSVEWPPASGPAYEGALPLVAMASASLLWGLQVDGPLRTLLSCRPLVWLGGISYGVYLFHWPVFVILRERGWVLDSTGGFGAAAAITLAVSVVSWQLVEMPVRRARRPSLATLRLGFAGTIVAAATASLLTISPSGVVASSDAFQRATAGSVDSLPGLAPGTTTTTTGAAGSVVATTVTASTITTTTVPSDRLPLAVPLPPAPSRPVRVMVVGDSTAFYVAEGLANFATTHPDFATLDLMWCQGCTFMLDAEIVSFPDLPDLLENSQKAIGPDLDVAVRRVQPDVAVLMVTVNDVADRRWPGEDAIDPLDPAFPPRLHDAYVRLTDHLLAEGVGTVVWVVPPTPTTVWKEAEMNDPARYAVQHQVIRDVVAGYPDRVVLCDLDQWLTDTGRAADETTRPDGTHFTAETATVIAEEMLGPWLVEQATGG